MTKTDAMAPIIALEATVTGGRTLQAYKRGGKDEARERFIEESTGAVVWLGGVKFLNWCGDKILEKIFGTNFDVGTDKVLRTPFDNFMKKHPPKGITGKQVAIIKAVKVLASVLLADAFIGLVVPKINQGLTRKMVAKDRAEKEQQKNQDKFVKESSNTEPSFKGGMAAINAFTNVIENTNTGKLLSTDAGLVSGRMYSARNKDERREIAIRDIGSIYFYMWAQGHVGNALNFIESGKTGRINPSSAATLDEHLAKFLQTKGGEMTVEEFRKAVLGRKSGEIKLPEGIKFESGELSTIEKFFNRFRKIPTEPLQVAKLSDIERFFTDKPEILERLRKMSELQPKRRGVSVITKQQIIDAMNISEINNPKLLDKIFSDFTGGHIDRKTGKYVAGASKNEYKYVSNKKLYDLKALMEEYVESICKDAENGKITKKVLEKAKKKNIIYSGINFAAGFAVAAMFLSTLIPKFQYWVTKKKTGSNEFPGMYELKQENENKTEKV